MSTRVRIGEPREQEAGRLWFTGNGSSAAKFIILHTNVVMTLRSTIGLLYSKHPLFVNVLLAGQKALAVSQKKITSR